MAQETWAMADRWVDPLPFTLLREYRLIRPHSGIQAFMQRQKSKNLCSGTAVAVCNNEVAPEQDWDLASGVPVLV